MSLAWLHYVPKNHLSAVLGWLAHVRLPRPFCTWLVRAFATYYKIDLSELSRPLESYRSIGEFFLRELRTGARPIPPLPERDRMLLSPVDGALRNSARIEALELEQIKGKRYRLEALLGGGSYAARLGRGTFFNLYLAPTNYHRVHSPVSGRIVAATYIPGKLWPVNDWSLNRIENLFSVNERIVTYIESEAFGLVAVVMVGATNVGGIGVTYDDTLRGNRWPWRGFRAPASEHRVYSADRQLRLSAGDELGSFSLGSTVILIVESLESEVAGNKPGPVRVGQSLS